MAKTTAEEDIIIESLFAEFRKAIKFCTDGAREPGEMKQLLEAITDFNLKPAKTAAKQPRRQTPPHSDQRPEGSPPARPGAYHSTDVQVEATKPARRTKSDDETVTIGCIGPAGRKPARNSELPDIKRGKGKKNKWE